MSFFFKKVNLLKLHFRKKILLIYSLHHLLFLVTGNALSSGIFKKKRAVLFIRILDRLYECQEGERVRLRKRTAQIRPSNCSAGHVTAAPGKLQMPVVLNRQCHWCVRLELPAGRDPAGPGAPFCCPSRGSSLFSITCLCISCSSFKVWTRCV